jgi:hypothetical protein
MQMSGEHVRRLLAVLLCAGAGLLMSAMPAGAADSSDANEWQFDADIYLWTPSLGGDLKSGGSVDIGFSQILEDLQFTFMGGFGASKGKWTLKTDVIYMDLDQKNNGQVNLPLGPGPGNATLATSSNVSMTSWIVTPTVRYNLVDSERVSFNVLAGARYLYLESKIKAQVVGPLMTRSGVISGSGDVWDGIVGGNGQVKLAPNWYLPYYADIGTGQSDLTWQGFAGIGYQFEHVGAVAGYRYLTWNFKNSTNVFENLTVKGPMFGVQFKF